MRIAQLNIKGFRGIMQATINFDDHTVLIGSNNSGKSTVIEAIALLFGRDRLVRHLTEHDFFGSSPTNSDRILLVATIVDFPGNKPDQNSDWFRDGRAVPKWWNPISKTIQVEKTQDIELLCAQIAFAARFDQETLSVESIRYFYDDETMEDPFDSEVITMVPGKLINDIGIFLIPISRIWERTISFGSELFRRLVTTLGGVPSQELITERDRLRNPNNPLESSGELGRIVERINSELSQLFPHRLSLQFRITATDSDALLGAIVPHYQYHGSTSLPAGRHGTGLLSIQTMLLLMEFGRFRNQQGKGFLLAIEEPELHLPPGLQRRLLYRLHSVASQTITTSHSPGVAAFYPATKVRVLENNGGNLSARPLLEHELTTDTPNCIRKLFRDNRYDLVAALMQECVLIPEGRIDYEWLRLLCAITETKEGWQVVNREDEMAFGAVIGVVPTHDASIGQTFEVISRLRSSVAALVDGDEAGDSYIDTLLACNTKPSTIIQWPSGWAIEDVVVWVLNGNTDALSMINTAIGLKLTTTDELRTILKAKRPGLKGDYLVYENIAGVMSELPPCLDRARQVLDALRSGIVNPTIPHPNLTVDSRSVKDCPILEWHP
ncbi:MAG: ATP-dependent nuclease [Bacteroidota bacterium]